MRDLKFRYVYKRDDDEDLAVYEYTLDEIADGKPLSTLNILNGIGGGYYGIEATLQYTGLIDANGIDVYEGDIISGDVDEQGTWEVVFCVDRDMNGWSVVPQDVQDGCVVIGNIHEHPELLKDN